MARISLGAEAIDQEIEHTKERKVLGENSQAMVYGVEFHTQKLNMELEISAMGLMVIRCRGEPAVSLGIETGDVIVGINRERFMNASLSIRDLAQIVGGMPRPIELAFWRFKDEKDRKSARCVNFGQGPLGMSLRNGDGPTGGAPTVVVDSVDAFGQAAELQVDHGDQIVGVNSLPLENSNVQELVLALKDLRKPPSMIIISKNFVHSKNSYGRISSFMPPRPADSTASQPRPLPVPQESRQKSTRNWGATVFDIVYNDIRIGLGLANSLDGRIVVTKAQFASAQHKIKPGDVIIGINDEKLAYGIHSKIFADMVQAACRPVKVSFWRNTTDAEDKAIVFGPGELGLTVKKSKEGIWYIADATKMSKAYGIAKGDYVVGVDHEPIAKNCDLPKIILEAGRPFALNVIVDPKFSASS